MGRRGLDLTPRYGGVTQRKSSIIDLTYIYILHKDSESYDENRVTSHYTCLSTGWRVMREGEIFLSIKETI